MAKDDKRGAAAPVGSEATGKVLEEAEHKMKRAVARVMEEFAAIRTGRATPGILDRLDVDYYGTPTPVRSIATVSTPDARTLVITPYDKTALGGIEKAIQKSDLGLHPSNDGQVIRLAFPMPTEERRRELAKLAKRECEEGKVAIRNVRRDEVDKIKAMEKKAEIPQDESKHQQDILQKLTDRYIAELDRTLAAKEAEIMEV
ncbi:MAG: ribosome recycling factor [Cyanobacteria bacterium REEB65]|nr:ribosome recycling factor [Cyanobacteria bacterium REEB65]